MTFKHHLKYYCGVLCQLYDDVAQLGSDLLVCVKRVNSIGPSTEPWGAPLFITRGGVFSDHVGI